MAKNLATVQTVPYIGTPYAQPIGLCTPPTLPPKIVRISIDWSLYGATSINDSLGVNVNLIGQAVEAPLDKIRSVYIDNTFSIATIYVFFPDTLWTVVCPPGAIVISPVATGIQNAIVYGEGFLTGQIPFTTVHFMNVEKEAAYIPASVSEDFTNPVELAFWGFGTGSGTDFNVGPIGIGDASADRVVVVDLQAYRADAIGITDVEVNANSMTEAVSALSSPGNVRFYNGLWYFNLTAGTSATIRVTAPAALTNAVIGVYTLKNLTTLTPADTDSAASNDGLNPGTRNIALDVVPNSALICGGITRTPGAFQNAAQDYQDSLLFVSPTNYNAKGASYFATANETRNVQLSNGMALVGASFI